MATNGKVEIKEVPMLEIRLRYIPTTGEFRVEGSQMDRVAQLGMIELAKHVLMQQPQEPSHIIMPSRGLPS